MVILPHPPLLIILDILTGCTTDGIPYTGNMSVTSSGYQCTEWSQWLHLYESDPGIRVYLADIGLFPDETYAELGAKCR